MKAFKTVVVAVLLLVLGWQGSHGVRAGWFEYHLFHLPRVTPTMPDDAGQLGLQPVEFPSTDGTTMRGWYIPSQNGAAVVMAGGSQSDRTDMLDHARALQGSGLGVLLFDWPGVGESDGKIGLGAAEREALRGAIRFTAARPGVTGKIGVIGFSLGAYTTLLVAADEPRVSAVVVEGAFRDFEEQTHLEYAHSGFLARWGAVIGARLGGMEMHGPSVERAVAQIAPRPVLFVTGSADQTVPPASTQIVFAAAREPKSLWRIEGAGHGEYLRVDATYGQRLRQYLTEALVPTSAPKP